MTEPPKSIRAIFLLTCLKILLAGGFFAFAMSTENPLVPPDQIGYTAAAYLALAVPTFIFIHRQNAIGVRAFIVLAIFASIPVRAFIGIGLDAIALILTFRKPAKQFFRSKVTAQAT